VRYLGVDYGHRRIGLALSDESAMLARPWQTVAGASSPDRSAERVSACIDVFTQDHPGEAIAGIVVGLPLRLNGDDNDQTPLAREFARRLAARTGLAVHLQDERLSSHEADARLGVQEKDWRRRKQKLDAAAAAIILQDFLDQPALSAMPRGDR
jgi:putative Holliday junction resolvase